MNNKKDICVSIVMAAYNAEKFVSKAIESALNQSIENIELIIIDDCSKDKTFDIIREYAKKDDRIVSILNEKNIGVAATRNKALDLCKGKYIAFLDSDDIWHINKLEKQLEALRQSNSDFSYTSYSMIDENDNKKCNDYIVPENISFKSMLKTNVIGCSTMMISKKIAEKYRFSLEFYHEDYVLWLELLKNGYKGIGIKDVLVDYRVMSTSKAGNKKSSAMYRFKIYREYLHFSFLYSSYLFIQYALSGLKKYRKV